jgi:cytoskeleton protein RodZ
MNHEADTPEEESAEAEPQGPRGGERLAEARRERQISVLEIAKELHIDEQKIRALENNEFDLLGAPVFAKGHLRKYSQLVGVDHEDVLTDYYRLTRSQSMPPVITRRKRPPRDLSPGPWIAGIAVILAAAISYWLIAMKPFETATPVRQEPAPAPVEAPVEEQVATDDAARDESVDYESADAVPAAPEPAATLPQDASPVEAAENRAQPVVAEGDVRLSITFLGDCWTEIHDAAGNQLYFGLGREGRTVNISGHGPLSVLFGDADSISLRVNGEDFAIADADRRGRTARLMLHGT